MCYNFRVKSKALFTISLCSVFAAAGVAAYGSSLFAAAATPSATEYPTIFTDYVNDNLDGVVDFATDGESFAFADKKGIIVVENEERTWYDIKNVSALDYYDGTYYYKQGPTSYSLPAKEEASYDLFPTDYSRAILADGSDYIIHTDGKCYYRAYGELSYSSLVGGEGDMTCSKLKIYDNVAYALLGSGTGTKNDITVKKLSGTACTDVNPSYIDFTGVETVALGTIKSSLQTYNLKELHFSKLNDGSYYTKINIDNLSGSYFDAKRENTFKCGDDGAISSDEIMLVLGESGNAKVFTDGTNCYIALSENLEKDDYTEKTSITEAEFTNAYINAPDWIYASPFLGGATKAVKLTAGDSVKVTGKVSTQIVGLQFYRVELGEGEEIVTGYVLSEFLQPYTVGETEHPDDKNFGAVKDPHYSDDDLVKVVVLLLIVIALVLIGLSYITYQLTSKKRKALKQAESQKDDENRKE